MSDQNLKRAVREYMAKHDVNYTTARRALTAPLLSGYEAIRDCRDEPMLHRLALIAMSDAPHPDGVYLTSLAENPWLAPETLLAMARHVAATGDEYTAEKLAYNGTMPLEALEALFDGGDRLGHDYAYAEGITKHPNASTELLDRHVKRYGKRDLNGTTIAWVPFHPNASLEAFLAGWRWLKSNHHYRMPSSNRLACIAANTRSQVGIQWILENGNRAHLIGLAANPNLSGPDAASLVNVPGCAKPLAANPGVVAKRTLNALASRPGTGQALVVRSDFDEDLAMRIWHEGDADDLRALMHVALPDLLEAMTQRRGHTVPFYASVALNGPRDDSMAHLTNMYGVPYAPFIGRDESGRFYSTKTE